MDLVNAVIAALGVGVTVMVAWVSTRTTRARRRAEEAQLALRLLEASREATDDPQPSDRVLQARLANTVRFATVEFTRLMLDDGPRWWSILPVLSYGILLLVTAAFTPSPNAATVFVWIAILCFVFSGGAVWIKRRRSRRLIDAGIHVPTLREILIAERLDWSRVFAERRAARLRKSEGVVSEDH